MPYRAVVPWWQLIVVVCAAAGLGFLLFLATRTGLFDVRTIDVEGAVHLQRSDVLGLSGITPATNAVWLDERTVEERLETDPWIRRAHVWVTLPWTVHITVRERRPVAALREPSGLVAVAGDGTALGPADPSAGLPVLVLPLRSALEGTGVSFVGSARAVGTLPPKLRGRVARVVVTTSGLEVFLVDGTRIGYGAADRFTAKATAIEDVLAWASARGTPIRALDVSAPSAPAIVLGG